MEIFYPQRDTLTNFASFIRFNSTSQVSRLGTNIPAKVYVCLELIPYGIAYSKQPILVAG
jgi:hypothetical protein